MRGLRIALILWSACYFGKLALNIIRIFKISNLIRKVNQLAKDSHNDLSKFISVVLPYGPALRNVAGFYAYPMSHTLSDEKNLEIFRELVGEAQDQLDYENSTILRFLNPFCVLNDIFMGPAWLLSQLGISMKPTLRKLISIIVWSIPILASIFDSEVHDWLMKFLK